MAGHHGHHPQHSQYADELFNANPSLSGAGSAVLDPGAGVDDYLDSDLNLDSGDPTISPFAPRTLLSSYQDTGFPSYTESELVSPSGTHANYEVTSTAPSAGSQHNANQSPYPVFSNARGSAPWNHVVAALPFHTRPAEREPDPQTPARPSKLSSVPLDSGYRSSSQYDVQSHMSTPATASMDPSYFMPQPFEQAPLESPFPDYDNSQQHQMNNPTDQDQDDDSQYEINMSQHQESIQDQQTIDFPQQGLQCRFCPIVSKTQSDWKKHHSRHTKPHVCSEESCARSKKGQGFATTNDRDRHVKSVHRIVTQEGKSYKCAAPGGCKSTEKDKIWPRLDNFKSHVLRMHADENMDEIVALSERDDLPNQERNEEQQVITRELHRQENEVRQQQATRRPSMSTIASNESGRNKRRAQDDLAAPRSTPRQRRNVPEVATLNTDVQYHNQTPLQDSRYLSPNTGGSMTHIFGRGYTEQRQNSHRPHTPHHQSDPQLMTAPGMTRSVSHQGNQYHPRRSTYANHQQFNHYQQPFQMPNFGYGANQPGQPIPEEAQSAYNPVAFDQTWGPPLQLTHQQYLNMYERHTVAGNLEYQGQPEFGFPQADPPIVNMAHHSEILVNVAPDLQHLSVSPTATGNDPVTPLPLPQSPHSPAPTVNIMMEDVSPTSDSDNIDEEVTVFLDKFENLKHLMNSHPDSRRDLKRFYQKARASSKAGSSARAEAESDDASSYAPTTSSTRTLKPQAQPQHQSQAFKTSGPTSATRSVVSTGSSARKTQLPWTPTTQQQVSNSKGKGKANPSNESSPSDESPTPSPPVPDQASAGAPKGTASATQTAISREQAGKSNSTCKTCGKAIGRGSDLKKHMKRHLRPYYCIWDGCQKDFGSKNDWKRHETVRHPKQMAGWRCDGKHPDLEAGKGVRCARWWSVKDAGREGAFEEAQSQYMQHLIGAGVGQSPTGIEEVHEVIGRCFIPQGHRGAFWCGFCDVVVAIKGPLTSVTDEIERDKIWLKERLDHIETHYLPEATKVKNDVWRELESRGRMKKDMEWFVPRVEGAAGGDYGEEEDSS